MSYRSGMMWGSLSESLDQIGRLALLRQQAEEQRRNDDVRLQIYVDQNRRAEEDAVRRRASEEMALADQENKLLENQHARGLTWVPPKTFSQLVSPPPTAAQLRAQTEGEAFPGITAQSGLLDRSREQAPPRDFGIAAPRPGYLSAGSAFEAAQQDFAAASERVDTALGRTVRPRPVDAERWVEPAAIDPWMKQQGGPGAPALDDNFRANVTPERDWGQRPVLSHLAASLGRDQLAETLAPTLARVDLGLTPMGWTKTERSNVSPGPGQQSEAVELQQADELGRFADVATRVNRGEVNITPGEQTLLASRTGGGAVMSHVAQNAAINQAASFYLSLYGPEGQSPNPRLRGMLSPDAGPDEVVLEGRKIFQSDLLAQRQLTTRRGTGTGTGTGADVAARELKLINPLVTSARVASNMDRATAAPYNLPGGEMNYIAAMLPQGGTPADTAEARTGFAAESTLATQRDRSSRAQFDTLNRRQQQLARDAGLGTPDPLSYEMISSHEELRPGTTPPARGLLGASLFAVPGATSERARDLEPTEEEIAKRRYKQLHEQGKSDEEIEIIIAREFPTQFLPRRTFLSQVTP